MSNRKNAYNVRHTVFLDAVSEIISSHNSDVNIGVCLFYGGQFFVGIFLI